MFSISDISFVMVHMKAGSVIQPTSIFRGSDDGKEIGAEEVSNPLSKSILENSIGLVW